MKKTKLFFLITGVFLLLSLLIMPLREGTISIGNVWGFKLSSIVGFVVIYPLTIYCLHRYKDKLSLNLITIAILVGVASLTLPIRILNFSGTLGSDLEYMIHIFSVVAGRVCYSLKDKKYIAASFSLLLLIAVLLTSTKGYDLWMYKLNYGTFTGNVERKYSSELRFETPQGEKVSLNNFNGKYLIIDCWFTHCGHCYQALPQVQELYEKYKKDKLIEVISLHSRIETNSTQMALHSRIQKNDAPEDLSSGEKILKENGYTIPCYSIGIDSPDLEKIGVVVYPTVLIINPEGHLVFRGKIDDVENFLNKIIEKEK